MEIKATREEKLDALRGWEARRKDMDSKIAQLEELTGISWESPFLESIRRVQEQDRIITSQIVEDKGEWLDWYCYENSFGADGMTIKVGDTISTVPDLESLLNAIEA